VSVAAAQGTTVCLRPGGTLSYPRGGGHRWVFLNWALGLRALGCRVIWLESVWKRGQRPLEAWGPRIAVLKEHLAAYGLADSLALFHVNGEPLPAELADGCLDLDAAAEASDVLLNQQYRAGTKFVRRFRRSALLDIDPGLLQVWMSKGWVQVAPHDAYFTIGETVGRPGARFADMGLPWQYTPPAVALDWWPPSPPAGDAPFTTVAHWYEGGGIHDVPEDANRDSKQAAFAPYLELPRRVPHPFELALDVPVSETAERASLEQYGWRVRHSGEVASTPWDYRRYLQGSFAEFSCAKPSTVELETAWISDRTICYLASGKPAVVQHTGPSRFLPDGAGLFRFRDLEEAVRHVEVVLADYERQCTLARALAEEYFDAKKVVGRVLERALA
jgi:hypothetical protein